MNRLEIFVLNKSAEVYTQYATIPDCMSFLHRLSRINNFSIVAHKGKRCIFIEKLDPSTLLKELNDFNNQP